MWPLLIASLLAQPAAEPPADSVAGPPPLIVKAKVDKDQLVSVQDLTSTMFQAQVRQRVVDGKTVNETVVVPIMTTTRVKKAWDLNKAKVTNGSGKKMDLDTVRKRLAVETLVVISADGKPISKGYLNLLRAEVIVIEASLVPARADPILPPPKK